MKTFRWIVYTSQSFSLGEDEVDVSRTLIRIRLNKIDPDRYNALVNALKQRHATFAGMYMQGRILNVKEVEDEIHITYSGGIVPP